MSVASSRLRLPPLNSLRVFEAVVRYGGISNAASELGVTQGAVSRQIKVLEQSLGFSLFERAGRSVKLSKDGHLYYRDVRDGLSQLRIATDRIVAAHSVEVVRVIAYATFATRWLIPRLTEFKRTYPTIDVQLTTSLNRTDFNSHNFDFAVRSGPREWPYMVSQKLSLLSVLTPVCSPSLIRGNPLTDPVDLTRFTLLHSIAIPNKWIEWFAASGAGNVAIEGGLRFESSTLAYEAALCGAGVALARPLFIKQELASGRLVAPFPHIAIAHNCDYLIYPEKHPTRAAHNALQNWILHEAESDNSPWDLG